MARVHRAVEFYAGVARDSLIARELVADVVGDTYFGRLTWRPERVPLATHILDEVRQRVRRMRAREMPISLSELAEDETPSTEMDDSEAAGKSWYPSEADLPDVIQGVRALAVGDAPVLQLLQLHELGVTRMRDVLWAGMPRAMYGSARKRLRRYALKALRLGPDMLRDAKAAQALHAPEGTAHR